jgi:hypothetical protein
MQVWIGELAASALLKSLKRKARELGYELTPRELVHPA